jgi:phosphoribosylformylglycinamidine cyclo-ligase
VAVLDRRSWPLPAVQAELIRRGGVDDDESLRVFNQGLGMVVVVAESAAATALELLGERGVRAAVVGTVAAGDPGEPAGIRVEGAARVDG